MSGCARGLMLLVRAYRLLLSPWLGTHCRFTPSCSAYSLEALAQHGATGGSLLTARRLLRCHPGCAGGLDPVPAEFSFFGLRGASRPVNPPTDSIDDRPRAGLSP